MPSARSADVAAVTALLNIVMFSNRSSTRGADSSGTTERIAARNSAIVV